MTDSFKYVLDFSGSDTQVNIYQKKIEVFFSANHYPKLKLMQTVHLRNVNGGRNEYPCQVNCLMINGSKVYAKFIRL